MTPPRLVALRTKIRRIAVAACLIAAAAPSRAQQAPAAPNPPAASGTPAAAAGGDTAPFKQMSLEQLMNQDVTSVAKEPESFSEAAAALDVITNDEIQRSGASGIPEALQLADNLEVAQKTSHDWAISARGFNTALSNKLLVLMDGRTLYTPLFSGVFWDVQDYLLQDIDRIEVISGPGGTLYGANAVNGVINITTKSAKDTQGGYLEVEDGSQLENSVATRYGVALAPDVYLRVYAKYFDRDSGVLTDGKDANDGWHMSQAGFRLDSYAATDATLTFSGDAYQGTEGVTTGGSASVHGENLIGRWARVFAPGEDMSVEVYEDFTHLVDPIPASAFAKAGVLVDNLATYNLDFQDRLPLGTMHSLTWGFSYRLSHDSVVNAAPLAFLPATLNMLLYSAFVQDDIKLSDTVTFTLGSKFEHNSYTGFDEAPDVRLKWDVTSSQMLWAAVSRAVRTPSRVDRDEAEPNPPPSVLRGGANFANEIVTAYELGYRAQLASWLTTSVSTFYNYYDDVRSLGYTPLTILPLVFQNNLAGDTYGAEVSATFQVLSWWRLNAAYDLLRENIYVKKGQIDLNNALNETADPVHQSFLRSSMDLPGNVELDASLRWIDPLKINNGGVAAWTPGYSELNASIGWHVTAALELSLTGQNLLHREHPEYGVPGPNLEDIQRNIYGKASWRF